MSSTNSSSSSASSQPGASSSAASDRKWAEAVREEQVIQAAAMPLSEIPSCSTLFDTWASCFALGPQLKAFYRYGEIQTCQSKLEDFKYCLTLKGLDPEQRRAVWIKHRAERAATQRLNQSSEDVWDLKKDELIHPNFLNPIQSDTANESNAQR